MRNLPVCVAEEDIHQMFTYADRDGDGQLSYKEFQVMIDPPPPPQVARPHVSDLGMEPQVQLAPCNVSKLNKIASFRSSVQMIQVEFLVIRTDVQVHYKLS